MFVIAYGPVEGYRSGPKRFVAAPPAAAAILFERCADRDPSCVQQHLLSIAGDALFCPASISIRSIFFHRVALYLAGCSSPVERSLQSLCSGFGGRSVLDTMADGGDERVM